MITQDFTNYSECPRTYILVQTAHHENEERAVGQMFGSAAFQQLCVTTVLNNSRAAGYPNDLLRPAAEKTKTWPEGGNLVTRD